MDFYENWWVLDVNGPESDKIFDHHIQLPVFIVLPVFEEQVRGHAPIYIYECLYVCMYIFMFVCMKTLLLTFGHIYILVLSTRVCLCALMYP